MKLSPVDIEQHLEPGEKIKWMGSPSHQAAAENSLSTAIIGTIFFGLLCVYHPSPAHPASELVDQLTDGSRLVVPFHIGPPMSDEDKFYALKAILQGISLLMILSPWLESIYAKATRLAITDRRLIVAKGGLLPKVTSYKGEVLQDLTHTTQRDGSGDITFGTEVTYDVDGSRRTRNVRLVGIPNIDAVVQFLREVPADPIVSTDD